VENVQIDRKGVANCNYSFYYHGRQTYSMLSEVPCLYTDLTGAFMYPLVSPYGSQGIRLRSVDATSWPVKEVTVGSQVPKTNLVSKGWISNIDTKNNIGVFYTTPVGFRETYQTFPRSHISGKPPLGKTNVIASHITARPGMSFSISFSVWLARRIGVRHLYRSSPQRHSRSCAIDV
jgi:uncharacterized membrane protein YoaT (DUF817 family)